MTRGFGAGREFLPARRPGPPGREFRHKPTRNVATAVAPRVRVASSSSGAGRSGSKRAGERPLWARAVRVVITLPRPPPPRTSTSSPALEELLYASKCRARRNVRVEVPTFRTRRNVDEMSTKCLKSPAPREDCRLALAAAGPGEICPSQRGLGRAAQNRARECPRVCHTARCDAPGDRRRRDAPVLWGVRRPTRAAAGGASEFGVDSNRRTFWRGSENTD